MPALYAEFMNSKPYLPFHIGYVPEKLIKKAEEELGETEEVKANAIAELRKMIEDEPNFMCQTDDFYMLQYLRVRKFDVKKAFSLLQNYHQVKKDNPDLYCTFDRNILMKAFQCGALTCLPYRDVDGCAVYVLRLSQWDPEEIPMKEAIVALTANILFCVEDPATQVAGVQILLDVKGTSIKQVKCVSLRYITLLSRALRNCIPARFRGIHICNETAIFGILWSILKVFLSEKINKRVHFHGTNLKSLHKFLPKAILPSEYGGDNAHFFNSDWFYNEVEPFFARFEELTTYGYTD